MTWTFIALSHVHFMSNQKSKRLRPLSFEPWLSHVLRIQSSAVYKFVVTVCCRLSTGNFREAVLSLVCCVFKISTSVDGKKLLHFFNGALHAISCLICKCFRTTCCLFKVFTMAPVVLSFVRKPAKRRFFFLIF